VLLQNGEFGSDAAAFPVIGLLGETIGRAENIAAQSQAAITNSTVVTRRLGLHPVQKRKTELSRFLQRRNPRLFRNSDHWFEPIVHLRPIRERNIAAVSSGRKISAISDASRMPEIEQIFRIAVAHKKAALQRFVRHVIANGPIELRPRPEIEFKLSEFIVLARPVDGVILFGPIIDGKSPCQRLLIERIGLGECVQLAGFRNRFCSEDVLDPAELQQFAGFRRINDKRRLDVLTLPVSRLRSVTPTMRSPLISTSTSA
jgi:hypothetical protein